MKSDFQLSKPLKYLCLTVQGLAILVMIMALWMFFSEGIIDRSLDMYWDRLSESSQAVVSVHEFKKSLLTLIATVSFFAPVLILIGVFRVMQTLRTSDPFKAATGRSVRFLGATIVAYAISRLVNYTLVILALTYDNPPGKKEFSIAVDTTNLTVLMIGIIILLVGHILTEATKLAEENRQFV